MSYCWSKTAHFANQLFMVAWFLMSLRGSALKISFVDKVAGRRSFCIANFNTKHIFSMESTFPQDRREFG